MTPLGLLGGTFDPIHQGHLDVALAAQRALALPSVLVMPSRVPPHRRPPHASPADRLAMVSLAVKGYEGLVASALEIEGTDDTTPSYTSATLDRLSSRFDLGWLYFITGADAFLDIKTWKYYPAILDRCHFVAVSRPGRSASELPALLPELAGRMSKPSSDHSKAPTIFLVDAPTSPVSSTLIRERIRKDESIESMVPAGVATYIAEHRLYKD